MAVACRAAIGPTSPRHDAGSTTTTPKWAANLLRNWIKLGTATRCSFPCQRVVRSRTDAPTAHPLCGTAPANAVIGITQMDTFDLKTAIVVSNRLVAYVPSFEPAALRGGGLFLGRESRKARLA